MNIFTDLDIILTMMMGYNFPHLKQKCMQIVTVDSS